jgi:hypothetical protein
MYKVRQIRLEVFIKKTSLSGFISKGKGYETEFELSYKIDYPDCSAIGVVLGVGACLTRKCQTRLKGLGRDTL